MNARLQEAWNNLIDASDAYKQARKKRQEARVELARRNQVHAQNRHACLVKIAALNGQIATAVRNRRAISATTVDEYLEESRHYGEIIAQCEADRRELHLEINATRESCSQARHAWLKTRMPRYEAKWAYDDAQKAFRQTVVELAEVPNEWRNVITLHYKNPKEDIQVLFGDTNDSKSPYHGCHILHPDGSITRKRAPRRLTA